MKRSIFRVVAPSFLLVAALGLSALAISLVQQRSAAKFSSGQPKQKTLRDRASEGDVVAEAMPSAQYTTFDEIARRSHAVVYGRIINSNSFWDESSDDFRDHGDAITTEYMVEVIQVLKKTRLNVPLESGEMPPMPLKTPLKIARNGGVVNTNGHRAEVRVKGYELLKPGQQYVFFLHWSTAYKAYILAGEMSGAVLVKDDQSLESLAESEDIRKKINEADLESLAVEISRRN